MESSAERWRRELAAWAIPAEIEAAAEDPPWGFPVELFPAEAHPAATPSRDRALETLPAGGSVLDIGCGGGAASLALAPPAATVIGVDDGEGMLAEFAATADARGVTHREINGRWPDAADQVQPVDVVVCHHVLYNIADLAPFVAALTAKARSRVVVELTAEHPMVVSGPLWQHFHGLQRPTGPTAQLAVAVLRDAGIDVHQQLWSRPPRDVPREAYVRLYRRRLCLPRGSEPDVDAVLPTTSVPRDNVTLWWDGTAT